MVAEDLAHDERREAEAGLVEHQQARACPSGRGRPRASAARRPRACRRAARAARAGAGTARRRRRAPRRCPCGRGAPAGSAPSSRLSSTGMVREQRARLGHQRHAEHARAPRASAGRSAAPSILRCVPRERSTPISALSRVDLPAPFGPMTVMTLAGARRRSSGRAAPRRGRSRRAGRVDLQRSRGVLGRIVGINAPCRDRRRAPRGSACTSARRAFDQLGAELHHDDAVDERPSRGPCRARRAGC